MVGVGIISGSGLSCLNEANVASSAMIVNTPYGRPSDVLRKYEISGHGGFVLARHGPAHFLAPHEINYRANIWALKDSGAEVIISLATVGGISAQYEPGVIVIPHQILDYTRNRNQTYFEKQNQIKHIDFSNPYCEELRELLIRSAVKANVEFVRSGVYAATDGPRLESVAEVDMLDRDGADIVGMTGMPEAALARELGLCYATIALVVNRAAGRSEGVVTSSEIKSIHSQAINNIFNILSFAVPEATKVKYFIPGPISPE